VTIDELLSGEELITLAETENHSNVKRIYNIISGIIDVLAVTFIVLPIYGEPQGNHIYHINLLSNTHMPNIDIGIHWAIILFIIGLGIARFAFICLDKESLYSITSKVSIAAGTVECLWVFVGQKYARLIVP
jgi:hypothetical protein